MPIIWSNKKKENNMKNINELTEDEAKFIIVIQNKYEFMQSEATIMVGIVKNYIDANQQNCATCGSSLRVAKDKMIKFYQANTQLINSRAAGVEPVIETIEEEQFFEEPIIEEVKPKKKKK